MSRNTREDILMFEKMFAKPKSKKKKEKDCRRERKEQRRLKEFFFGE